MEKIDRDLQQRVWQRVRSGQSPDTPIQKQDNLKAWLLAAQENAADYQKLAKKYGGKQGDTLRNMARQLDGCVACCKGLCRIRGERFKPAPLPPGSSQCTLEKCYHREMRLCREAQSRIEDPQHGPVFAKLARQSADRCMLLAQMIGNTA